MPSCTVDAVAAMSDTTTAVLCRPVLQEWLTTHLVSLLNHPPSCQASVSVTCEAIHLVLVLLQYSPLAHLRSEVPRYLCELQCFSCRVN